MTENSSLEKRLAEVEFMSQEYLELEAQVVVERIHNRTKDMTPDQLEEYYKNIPDMGGAMLQELEEFMIWREKKNA